MSKEYNGPKCPFCHEKLILDMNMNITYHNCGFIELRDCPMVEFDAVLCRLKCMSKADKKRKAKDD